MIRGTLEAGESSLTEAKRNLILDCAKELSVNEDAKLQEVLISIAIEGMNDPVVTARVFDLLAAAQRIG